MVGTASALEDADPTPAAAGVAAIQEKHDRALVAELAAYVRDQPQADDREQAYAILFNKAIEHDWFTEIRQSALAYLKDEPDGPIKSLAQIVLTMASAREAKFDEAIARFKDLMEGVGQEEQGEFALSFSDTLAGAAIAAGDYKAARQVLQLLQERFPESPDIQQKVRADLKRLDRVGKLAPAIDTVDLDGKAVTLESLRGKYVLVDFWATWCTPCLEELPRLEAAYQNYHDNGFEIVAISLDEERPDVASFVTSRKLPWRQIHNASGAGDLVEAFGVTSIPASFLIDPQGVVIRLDLRGPRLDSTLTTLLGQKAAE
jgi:thiol-disulfide isomerase/thioredoxin